MRNLEQPNTPSFTEEDQKSVEEREEKTG